MNRLDKVLKQFPNSVEEHRKNISNYFGIDSLNYLEKSYIFGAKELGRKILRTLQKEGISVAGFIDNNEKLWGTKINNLPVLSPKKLLKIENPHIIIANRYIAEINEQLSSLGIKNIIPHYVLTCLFPTKFPNVLHDGSIKAILSSKPEIKKIYNLLADDKSKELFADLIEFRLKLATEYLPKICQSEEYFPGNFWRLSNEEVFVDVGAYNGDTLKSFLKNTKRFKKYIALEPDKKNYDDLIKSIPENVEKRVITICAGAGSRNTSEKFSGFGREDSLIDKNGTEQIKIVKLDDLLTDQLDVATTVKIDVEGYEPEVIKGMKEILIQSKPKIALCVYHRPNHLWTLPIMLIKQNKSYEKNLYLRHHENELYGTVLYAF